MSDKKNMFENIVDVVKVGVDSFVDWVCVVGYDIVLYVGDEVGNVQDCVEVVVVCVCVESYGVDYCCEMDSVNDDLFSGLGQVKYKIDQVVEKVCVDIQEVVQNVCEKVQDVRVNVYELVQDFWVGVQEQVQILWVDVCDVVVQVCDYVQNFCIDVYEKVQDLCEGVYEMVQNVKVDVYNVVEDVCVDVCEIDCCFKNQD